MDDNAWRPTAVKQTFEKPSYTEMTTELLNLNLLLNFKLNY